MQRFFILKLIFLSLLKHRLWVYVRTASNKYPQSMFWSKKYEKYIYPCKTQFYGFYNIKVWYEGVYTSHTCVPDGICNFTVFRDAWNKLGDMDREVAMLNYVDELKKV